jgi:AmmeMemoRadiSam system protein B
MTGFARLRPDLQWNLLQDGQEQLLLAEDPLGYAPAPVALSAAAAPLLEALWTSTSWEEFRRQISLAPEEFEELRPTLEQFLRELDEHYLLLSPRFEQRRLQWEQEYRLQPVRPAALAGISYPESPEALRATLTEALLQAPRAALPARPYAAVIPHIDLRVGIASYAAAYRVLEELRPELVVILGTSHYGWHAPYILTEKDFQTPLGMLQTARELVQALHERCPHATTLTDVAHRPEHSIEFQLLFVQHLFGDAPPQILPILVTSFAEYVESGTEPEGAAVGDFAAALSELVAASGKRALWIASADMAHIGPKFGDSDSAHALAPDAQAADRALLEALQHGDYRSYFRHIAHLGDRYRICGLPPVYTLLAALRPRQGILLDYRIWHEAETRSAVSFASLVYVA